MELEVNIGFTTIIDYLDTLVLQDMIKLYTMSSVQVKAWKVIYTLIMFISASHIQDTLKRPHK